MSVTVCPAAAAHSILEAEPQFFRRAVPVAAHFIAGGDCVSTGISFGDYEKMQTMTRGNYKRRDVPTWSDGELQEILCGLLEHRVGYAAARKVPKSLTRVQRIDASHKRLLTRRAGLLKALDEHVARYMELRAAGLPTKSVERKIALYDAQLLMLPRLPAILCATIYMSYRLGFTSTQVAYELKCSPVFIRQVLSRARVMAGRIERGESSRSCGRPKKKSTTAEVQSAGECLP